MIAFKLVGGESETLRVFLISDVSIVEDRVLFVLRCSIFALLPLPVLTSTLLTPVIDSNRLFRFLMPAENSSDSFASSPIYVSTDAEDPAGFG